MLNDLGGGVVVRVEGEHGGIRRDKSDTEMLAGLLGMYSTSVRIHLGLSRTWRKPGNPLRSISYLAYDVLNRYLLPRLLRQVELCRLQDWLKAGRPREFRVQGSWLSPEPLSLQPGTSRRHRKAITSTCARCVCSVVSNLDFQLGSSILLAMRLVSFQAKDIFMTSVNAPGQVFTVLSTLYCIKVP